MLLRRHRRYLAAGSGQAGAGMTRLRGDAMAESDSPNTIAFDDFLKVDIRAGRVVDVQPFPEARKPAFKLWIDFGPGIGVKKSSAQITELYSPDELIGRQVLAVVNFPPRQIGPFRSEVLTLGCSDSEGRVVLLTPDSEVPPGARMH